LLTRRSILGWSARIRPAASPTEASDARSSGCSSNEASGSAPRLDARAASALAWSRCHHDVAALAGELPGYLESEPAVRAGHHGDPARLIGDVRGGPGHAQCYVDGSRKRVSSSR
jgi:hypothetical protein